MRKIFNFAMEDDSEEDLDPSTEDVGSSEEVPTDGAAAPEEEVGESTDDTPEEEKVDLHPDNEPADLSELNVQKLSEASQDEEDEELRKEHESASDESHEALSDMDTLMVAQECLANCLTTHHKGALGLAQRVHADYREKHGLGPMRKAVSLESFDSVDTVSLAMESIADTVKTVITAIVSAIRKAIQWLKTWFKTYFSQTKLVAAALDRAQGIFLDFRKANGEKMEAYYKASNVDLFSFVQGFKYKGILSNNGRQPGEKYVGGSSTFTDMYGTERSSQNNFPDSYSKAFKELNKLVEYNTLFDKYIDKGCLKSFEIIEEALSTNAYPTETLIFFTPRAFIPKDAISCEHAEGVTREDETELYCKDGYIGNRSVVVQVTGGRAEHVDKLVNGMYDYAQWKMWLKSNTGFMPNGNMRYLTTGDAVSAYTELKKVGVSTLSFQKTSDQIEYVLSGLLTVLGKLSAGLDAKANSEETTLGTAGWDSVKKFELVRETIAAAQAITAINSTFLAPTSAYARDVMRAWYEYIKATLETENAYILKAKASK